MSSELPGLLGLLRSPIFTWSHSWSEPLSLRRRLTDVWWLPRRLAKDDVVPAGVRSGGQVCTRPAVRDGRTGHVRDVACWTPSWRKLAVVITNCYSGLSGCCR
jgi:hypothetical protein